MTFICRKRRAARELQLRLHLFAPDACNVARGSGTKDLSFAAQLGDNLAGAGVSWRGLEGARGSTAPGSPADVM